MQPDTLDELQQLVAEVRQKFDELSSAAKTRSMSFGIDSQSDVSFKPGNHTSSDLTNLVK